MMVWWNFFTVLDVMLLVIYRQLREDLSPKAVFYINNVIWFFGLDLYHLYFTLYLWTQDVPTLKEVPQRIVFYPSKPMHYAARADIWKKSYHEMFNFENLFLCQFSSNTRFSFGGGSLNTPKIGKCKKEFTNINLRGFKAQKTWRGCLSRIKRVSKFSFLYMLWYLLS